MHIVCSCMLRLLILPPATSNAQRLKHTRFDVIDDPHTAFWVIPQKNPVKQWTCVPLGVLHVLGNTEDPALVVIPRCC